jgi:ribonuclease P protein component
VQAQPEPKSEHTVVSPDPVLWRRLLKRDEFRAVLAAPVIAKTPHFALHQLLPASALTLRMGVGRIGAVTPKRWAKRSVTRNALKRQIYNVADMQSSSKTSAAYVVRLRQAFAASEFVSASSPQLKSAARQELLTLWQRV